MTLENQKGFTLAELLVVIAIMGILTIVVMVNFDRGKHSNDLQQAGTEFLQDLRLAQNYTIGGSSLNYCDSNSDNKFGYSCPVEGQAIGCDGTLETGTCVNGVPLGGYGVNIASAENYTVFADTNNNQKLDGPNRVIILRTLTLKGIHVSHFKLGDQISKPAGNNYLNILFEPPQGTVHFFVGSDEFGLVESQEVVASILVSSDYVSNSCRKVTINRISGQISESQSECSL